MEDKKKVKKEAVFLGIICALLLLLGGYVFVKNMTRDNSKNVDTTEIEEQEVNTETTDDSKATDTVDNATESTTGSTTEDTTGTTTEDTTGATDEGTTEDEPYTGEENL